MTTQTKGTLLQRTGRLFRRGYELLTIQELKLTRFLQHKLSLGYPIGRLLAFSVKLIFIALFILLLSWVVFIVLAVFAVYVSLTSPQKPYKDTDSSNTYDYNTPGTLEHISANPDIYDNYGNFK